VPCASWCLSSVGRGVTHVGAPGEWGLGHLWCGGACTSPHPSPHPCGFVEEHVRGARVCMCVCVVVGVRAGRHGCCGQARHCVSAASAWGLGRPWLPSSMWLCGRACAWCACVYVRVCGRGCACGQTRLLWAGAPFKLCLSLGTGAPLGAVTGLCQCLLPLPHCLRVCEVAWGCVCVRWPGAVGLCVCEVAW
jgi:hypothetical protein